MKTGSVVVETNKQRTWDSFNAYQKALEKAGAAIKSFHTCIRHSAASARRFHEDMEALTKTEEGK